MKKPLTFLGLIVFMLALVSPTAAQSPTITFVNPPQNGLLELNVGESYTFEVQVTSDPAFNKAQLGLSQYYPGRSVFADGIVSARGGTSATLKLSITGKTPTDKLPGGVAPMTLVVGVRYQGGEVVSQSFEFNVRVK